MPPQDQSWHPLTVLVVDDSADTAESLAELFTLRCHTVRVALNGVDALRSIATEVPDVVFLDLWMPGLGGYEVAERIRNRCSRGKRPFLVAVTGCGSDADRRRSAEAGFDLHLVKPVDPAVLVGLLERFRQLLTPLIPAEDPPDAWSLQSPPGPVGDLPCAVGLQSK